MPETPRLPAGTVTFLFTDIEGSTRLWEAKQDAMQLALARHDAIVRVAIEGNHGYLIKSTGDGAHAAFSTAADALAASIAAQRALTSYPWDEAVIKSRMALHTGTAEQRDGDYHGPALNRAARLMASGHGGQILLSLATMELVRDHMPADTTLRDLGERRLKDLIRPEHVYQVVAPDLPREFPALNTLDARPNNLPTQTTSLIGREREIRVVGEKLSAPGVRLLTLTGMGGTGKTRLALQVAADMADEFEHGVFLVDLATLRDPALVLPTIAYALGVSEAKGRPLEALLHEHLRDKQLLLVLDNFEQVIESGPLASALLAHAPALKILVTSHELLHVSGEHVYPVPTLPVPDPRQVASLETLTQYEAVALFIDRALMVKPAFSVTNATAPAIAEICYQLDGLPLAIELAAARVQLLPPDQMLAQLHDRLRFLKGGGRDRPVRQQTLRDTIDWSHDLLTPEEQEVFRRLAVFSGGCTPQAAENVCDAEDVDVFEAVESLTAKNLLKPDEAGGELRIAMLETVRDYAAERLEAADEKRSAAQRHQEHFLSLAELAQRHWFGPSQAMWVRRLENDYGNLRAALEHALESANPEESLRFCAALGRLWEARGHVAEGRSACSRALSKVGGKSITPGCAATHATVALLARDQGDYAAADLHYHESLAIYRELGDRGGIARALNGLGNVAFARDDLDTAQQRYQESLAMQRELGDRVQIAGGLNNLGIVALLRGDLIAATDVLEEAAAMARELGDRSGVAGSLSNLGVIALERGDLATAQARFEQCLAISHELSHRFGIAKALHALGIVARRLGNFPLAWTRIEESLAIDREMGNQPGMADGFLALGNIAYERADYATSRAMFQESLALWRKLETAWGVCYTLSGLASLVAVEGDVLRAARIWGHTERLAESISKGARPADEERIARARAAFGNDELFTSAWREGRGMTSERAIELATTAAGASSAKPHA